MIKVFDKSEISVKDYNFIISNLILSQKSSFTYNTLLDEIQVMFGEINDELKCTLRRALLRLRDDGFLSILGSIYKVQQVNI